jgi:hypothetical protein
MHDVLWFAEDKNLRKSSGPDNAMAIREIDARERKNVIVFPSRFFSFHRGIGAFRLLQHCAAMRFFRRVGEIRYHHKQPNQQKADDKPEYLIEYKEYKNDGGKYDDISKVCHS